MEIRKKKKKNIINNEPGNQKSPSTAYIMANFNELYPQNAKLCLLNCNNERYCSRCVRVRLRVRVRNDWEWNIVYSIYNIVQCM